MAKNNHKSYNKKTKIDVIKTKKKWLKLRYGFAILAAVLGCYLVFISDTVTSVFAPSKDNLVSKCMNITCSKDYHKHPIFSGCTPQKVCGRCVKDGLLNEDDVQVLRNIAEKGLAFGGSNGGASIFDLHSGALSKGDKFVNIYKYLSKETLLETFDQQSINAYTKLKNKIHQTIAVHFGINPSLLYLTKPTFFSRMTSAPAKTKHDEYWHSHIDKIQYGSFDYTALIYLTTYSRDFDGGQFVFDDRGRDVTIEPKGGRVSFFTSGSENPHHVEKVISGTRFALTIAFTCDPSHAIKDPNIQV